jgi:hypothetical protein
MPKDKESCYMFELFTALNPNQIKPTRDRIVCHGARHLTAASANSEQPLPAAAAASPSASASAAAFVSSTSYLPPRYREWCSAALERVCTENGWEFVPRFAFTSLQAVMSAARALNGGEREGFVVCDRHFNRSVTTPFSFSFFFRHLHSRFVSDASLASAIVVAE